MFRVFDCVQCNEMRLKREKENMSGKEADASGKRGIGDGRREADDCGMVHGGKWSIRKWVEKLDRNDEMKMN